MLRTFNCGVGMVVVADADRAPAVASALADEGETVMEIGRLLPREGGPAVGYRGTLAL
jgi:phosphoribosylformylglycinamidine cyclo-ligase